MAGSQGVRFGCGELTLVATILTPSGRVNTSSAVTFGPEMLRMRAYLSPRELLMPTPCTTFFPPVALRPFLPGKEPMVRFEDGQSTEGAGRLMLQFI